MVEQTFIIGIIMTMIFYEATGISPGGLIVPSYFALYLDSPYKMILTLIVSLITYVIVKLISRHAVLYGRRKFFACILVSFIIKIILKYFSIYIYDKFNINIFYENIIGILVSAILANELLKNTIIKTLSSLIILAIAIKVIIKIIIRVGVLL